MPQERIPEASQAEQRVLFGPLDRHLRAVRDRYGVRIAARRGGLWLDGPDDRTLKEVSSRVRQVLERTRETGGSLTEEEVEKVLFDGGPRGRATRPGARGRGASGPAPASPKPLTPNQGVQELLTSKSDVVFSIGPAGAGKTYLAVAEAVEALRTESVRKIILTRPAVEAGEKLGFLPGDFQAKINPYLRPLYDALGELLPYGEVQRYVDADVIEIVPLAYMRGRTLKQSFIILDEAQNTTPIQMKMFLTRMGTDSRVVVTGDITHVDLPEDTPSGLVQSIGILDGVPGIEVIRFGPQDIQRHPLVQRIVDAYERAEKARAEREPTETEPAEGEGDEE